MVQSSDVPYSRFVQVRRLVLVLIALGATASAAVVFVRRIRSGIPQVRFDGSSVQAGTTPVVAQPPATTARVESAASEESGRDAGAGVATNAPFAVPKSGGAAAAPCTDFDAYIAHHNVNLWGPDRPPPIQTLTGDEAAAGYFREHQLASLWLGTCVRRGTIEGGWTQVRAGALQGWVDAREVVAAADAKEATILQPAKLNALDEKGYGREVPLAAGTLLLAVAREGGVGGTGGVATVRLSDGTVGSLASCVLSFDPAEIAVARALASSQSDRDEAKAKQASARLAPILDGRPPVPAQCGAAPPAGASRAHRPQLATAPLGIEVLGIWQPDHSQLLAPHVYDWEALARAYGGIRRDGPLPPRQREEVRLAQVERDSAVGENSMFVAHPSVTFDVPAAESRGAYYGFTSSGVVTPATARLAGKILVSVNCNGCEVGPREYSGKVVLSFAGSSGPAIVVWSPVPVQFTDVVMLPTDAWTAGTPEGLRIRLLGASGQSKFYSVPSGQRRGPGHGKSIPEKPISIRSAYTALAGGGPLILVVDTNGNEMCTHGLYLFEVREDALRPLGGTEFDCDV
jgi:hypothetical protein